MDNETVERLKQACGNMLKASNLKATSKDGKHAIHAFWIGATSALNESTAYITICLMAGRHDELVS